MRAYFWILYLIVLPALSRAFLFICLFFWLHWCIECLTFLLDIRTDCVVVRIDLCVIGVSYKVEFVVKGCILFGWFIFGKYVLIFQNDFGKWIAVQFLSTRCVIFFVTHCFWAWGNFRDDISLWMFDGSLGYFLFRRVFVLFF